MPQIRGLSNISLGENQPTQQQLPRCLNNIIAQSPVSMRLSASCLNKDSVFIWALFSSLAYGIGQRTHTQSRASHLTPNQKLWREASRLKAKQKIIEIRRKISWLICLIYSCRQFQ